MFLGSSILLPWFYEKWVGYDVGNCPGAKSRVRDAIGWFSKVAMDGVEQLEEMPSMTLVGRD